MLCICISLVTNAQSKPTVTTIRVEGNCEMCKKSIESALVIPGVYAAFWNPDSKKLKLKFDTAQITIDAIQRKLADIGYDNQGYRAADSVYSLLHKCCKYERK